MTAGPARVPVALYAPMKPPDDPRPSGDRRMARLLQAALQRAGFAPTLASRFKSREADGDGDRQTALIGAAADEAARLVAALRPDPPACWITYHCYYKAPDLIGPTVARALAIPYLLVEASHAAKRLTGPHARFAQAAADAIAAADLILQPSPADAEGAAPLLKPGATQIAFPPFLESARYRADAETRAAARAELAAEYDAPTDRPWLVTAAMMRPGAKARSYAVLAEALRRLAAPEKGWVFLAAGDGPARAAIEAGFEGLANVRFVHELGEAAVARLYAAGDLFLWPAVEEAYGIALLEAQAAGLPAVIGDRPGPRALVAPGETALLTPEGDTGAFAAATDALLSDPPRRRRMGEAAAARVAARHDLAAAAERLAHAIHPLLAQTRKGADAP